MSPENLWTIGELAAEAAVELSKGQVDQKSRRVSASPNLRTIRYYATHGLLDRPVTFRGRTAYYGRRHLLQLIAIKRLQSLGLTLVEIQQRLLGLGDEELLAVGELGSPEAEQPPRSSFWTEEPAMTSSATDKLEGLKLSEDVILMLTGPERELYEDDAQAIRAAAAPLLKILRTRGLAKKGGNDR